MPMMGSRPPAASHGAREVWNMLDLIVNPERAAEAKARLEELIEYDARVEKGRVEMQHRLAVMEEREAAVAPKEAEISERELKVGAREVAVETRELGVGGAARKLDVDRAAMNVEKLKRVEALDVREEQLTAGEAALEESRDQVDSDKREVDALKASLKAKHAKLAADISEGV